MIASEIREALAEVDRDAWWEPTMAARLIEAARAYADLLEKGQEVIARDRLTGWNPVMEVSEPGRYLVVRVGESP